MQLFLEVLRYLGIKDGSINEQTKNAILSGINEVEKVENFKSYYKVFDFVLDGENIKISTLNIKSKALSLHLKNAKKIILYTATLGQAVDKLLNSYAKTDVYMQVIIQAVATAIIENHVDSEQENLKKDYCNYKILSRFSPGYGDLSLEYQSQILNLLNAQKNCGIFANESNVLIPSKSITAVIGLF